MKIIVIGNTGTIGRAVAEALAPEHEVVGASRKGDVKVDLEDRPSIEALFDAVTGVDAVVCCAGNPGGWGPVTSLSDADFDLGLRSKLMGQVNLVRVAQARLKDGGSITLTSGALSRKPSADSPVASMVSAGIEGFVRAAALAMPRGIRVNVVRPPWISETLVALGKDPRGGILAREVARLYVAAVDGPSQGMTLEPA